MAASADPPVWDPTELQTVLNAFLDRQGWSQNRLSVELGVSQTAVNRWFQPFDKEGTGKVTRPRTETLAVLARLMSYPYSDLLRMCGYPVEGTTAPADAAFSSLTSMMRSAYEATSDQERRQIGLDAIQALVQSVWASHPRRRSGRPRSRENTDTGGIIALASYA